MRLRAYLCSVWVRVRRGSRARRWKISCRTSRELVALRFLEHEFHQRVALWVRSLAGDENSELLTCAITEFAAGVCGRWVGAVVQGSRDRSMALAARLGGFAGVRGRWMDASWRGRGFSLAFAAGLPQFGGEAEEEGGALVGLGLGPDVAVVAFDDFLDYG